MTNGQEMPGDSRPTIDYATGNTPAPYRRLDQIALLVWAIVLIVMSIRMMISPEKRSVWPVFENAGKNWLEGNLLYPVVTDKDFRYLPIVAAFFAPLSWLPDRLGQLIWRWMNFGVYLWGILWCCRAGIPRKFSRDGTGILLLLALPLSLGSLSNAQANPMLMGGLLIGIAGIFTGWWWVAAIGVAVATLLKVYPIAVGLLLTLFFPIKFGTRFFAALIVGLLLPFVLQKPAYVADQYRELFSYLKQDSGGRERGSIQNAYRDVRIIGRFWFRDYKMPNRTYAILQLTSAVIIAGTCLMAWRKNWEREKLLALIVALGCGWMLAFGPSTEGVTFLLIAVPLAWCLIDINHENWTNISRMMILISAGLFLLTVLSGLFPRGSYIGRMGVHSIATLFLMGALIFQVKVSPRNDVRPLVATL